MATAHGAEHGTTPTDYIVHHLTHLKVGEGFWTWHIDTLLMSALLAILVGWVFRAAARAMPSSLDGATSFMRGSSVVVRPAERCCPERLISRFRRHRHRHRRLGHHHRPRRGWSGP